MRDDVGRLADILEAIERIEKHKLPSRASFEEDELVQTWVVYHLQIIGEASRGISESLREKHTEVPWSEIVAMRNILVHHYFGIEIDEVWSTVETDLPDLKKKILSILKSFKR